MIKYHTRYCYIYDHISYMLPGSSPCGDVRTWGLPHPVSCTSRTWGLPHPVTCTSRTWGLLHPVTCTCTSSAASGCRDDPASEWGQRGERQLTCSAEARCPWEARPRLIGRRRVVSDANGSSLLVDFPSGGHVTKGKHRIWKQA